MKQTLYESKPNKKKSSQFVQKLKKPQLKKLITRLSESHEAHQLKLIQDIIENRKKKIRQIRQMRANFIYQKPMIPVSPTDRFSFETSLSSGEPFLNQKIKNNILAPDRMYTHQPNMRAGSLDQSKMISFQSNKNPKVISKKFEEYVRLIQLQDGALRRKRLTQLSNQNYSLPAIKSPYKITMKKTYFKKFPSDQFNFYKPPIKDISRSERVFENSLRQSISRSRSRSRSRDLSSFKTSPREYLTLQRNLTKDTDIKTLKKNLKTIEAVKTLDAYRQS